MQNNQGYNLGFSLGQLFKQAKENITFSDVGYRTDLPSQFDKHKTDTSSISTSLKNSKIPNNAVDRYTNAAKNSTIYSDFGNKQRTNINIDPYYSAGFGRPKTLESWTQQVYGGNKPHLRKSVTSSLENKGYDYNSSDFRNKFYTALNKRAPSNLNLMYQGKNSLGGSTINYDTGSNQTNSLLRLSNAVFEKSTPIGKVGPGRIGIHELEHTNSGPVLDLRKRIQRYSEALNSAARTANMKPPKLPDKDSVLRSATETPAVMSEMAHLGQQAKEQLGQQAVNDVNVPLGPQGSGISLGNLIRDAKRFGHLGGNKSVTELLNTPEGQAWLRHWIGKHQNRNQ